MINLLKHNQNWILSSILMLGAVLFSAFIWEFSNTTRLAESAQKTSVQRIEQLFSNRIHELVSQYPSDFKQLQTNWRNSPLEFALYRENELLYPADFSVHNESNKTANDSVWREYFEQSVDLETGSRAEVFWQIKRALMQGEGERVRALTETFINHLRFYKRSAIEELVSRLAFIHIEESYRWHESVIRRLLLEGESQFEPAMYYLFLQSNGLTQRDYNRGLTLLKRALEQAAITDSTLAQLEKSTAFKPSRSDERHDLVLTRNKLIKNVGPDQLIVPFDASAVIDGIRISLIETGSLSPGDEVTIHLSTPTPIADARLHVSRKTWQTQHKRNTSFLWIKLGLVTLFMLALMALIKRYQAAHRHKMAKVVMQQTFISFVGHELKTPLASIRLMAETLSKRAQKDLPLKDYPERITQESDKLTHMVENLLSLQMLQNDHKELSVANLNLQDLFLREVELLSGRYQVKMELVMDFDTEQEVVSHSELFPLVIRNLLDNAFKYCSGKPPKVNVSFDNERRMLTVTDNGIGLEESDSSRIFELFAQSGSSRQGFGLGLALCKTIMSRLGGDIAVGETSKSGTSWQVTL